MSTLSPADRVLDATLYQVLVVTTVILVAKMLTTNLYSLIPSIMSGHHSPEDSAIMTRMLNAPPQSFGRHMVAFDAENNTKALLNKPKPSEITKSASNSSSDGGWEVTYQRSQRVIGNDLENIPITLVVMWVAGIVVSQTGDSLAIAQLIWLAKLFWIARVAHSVTYSSAIPVVRSIAFLAGCYSSFHTQWYARSPSWQAAIRRFTWDTWHIVVFLPKEEHVDDNPINA